MMNMEEDKGHLTRATKRGMDIEIRISVASGAHESALMGRRGAQEERIS